MDIGVKKVLGIYNKIEEWALVYSFLILIIVVFMQVVFRTAGVVNPWTDELSRYIYIWECWLGLSLCQRYHEHIRITIITDRIKGKGHYVIECVVDVICIVTVGVLAYFGFQLVSQQLMIGTTSPYLDLPKWIMFLSMPLSCVVYGVRMVIEFCYHIRGKDFDTEELDEGVGL